MNSELENLLAFRDALRDNPIFVLGTLLLFGSLMGRLAKVFKLPSLTGQIVAGLFLGPSLIGIISHEWQGSFHAFTQVALGAIAFNIGTEFELSQLRPLGISLPILSLAEGLGAFLFVTISLSLVGMPLPFAALLGSIAPATAPGTTMALIGKLGERGKFVNYLLSLVALADVNCLIFFGIVSPIVLSTFAAAPATVSVGSSLMHALGELFFSVVLGIFFGWLLQLATRRTEREEEALATSVFIGLAMMAIAGALVLELSQILVMIAAGAILTNSSPPAQIERIHQLTKPLENQLFLIFFVLAGAELRADVFSNATILVFGMTFVFSRLLGKYSGIYSAAGICRLDSRIRQYLGLCLFPEAGVAIGLSLEISSSPVVRNLAPEQQGMFNMAISIILLAVFVAELFGPPIVRYALVQGTGFCRKK